MAFKSVRQFYCYLINYAFLFCMDGNSVEAVRMGCATYMYRMCDELLLLTSA